MFGQEYQSLIFVFNVVKDFEGWRIVVLEFYFLKNDVWSRGKNGIILTIFISTSSISIIFVAHSNQISMKFLVQ